MGGTTRKRNLANPRRKQEELAPQRNARRAVSPVHKASLTLEVDRNLLPANERPLDDDPASGIRGRRDPDGTPGLGNHLHNRPRRPTAPDDEPAITARPQRPEPHGVEARELDLGHAVRKQRRPTPATGANRVPVSNPGVPGQPQDPAARPQKRGVDRMPDIGPPGLVHVPHEIPIQPNPQNARPDLAAQKRGPGPPGHGHRPRRNRMPARLGNLGRAPRAEINPAINDRPHGSPRLRE